MGFANLLILALTGVLFGIALRNLLGHGSPIGIRSGWAAMIGFSALAAWCFWKVREFRMTPATAGAMASMQKFMVVYLLGLLLSAVGVTRQRKLTRKPPAPPVS